MDDLYSFRVMIANENAPEAFGLGFPLACQCLKKKMNKTDAINTDRGRKN